MRCLFCKAPSHDAKSVEHILPESIGSKKRILSPGVICDKCNNYFATSVEGPLLSHPSFRNVRAWWTVPTKKGKFPSLVGILAGTDIHVAVHNFGGSVLQILPERDKDRPRFDAYAVDAEASGTEPIYLFQVGEAPPAKEMSRFLAKMALEALYERLSHDLSQAEQLIDETHFDRIRNYARYGNNFPEWPYYRRRVFPEETVMRHPTTNKWVQVGFGCNLLLDKRREMFFAFGFYGMEYVINVGGPSIHGYEEWLREHNHISPLVELGGHRLVKREENGRTRFYLEDDDTALKRYHYSLRDHWGLPHLE